MAKGCNHIAGIRDVTPSALGCEECLKSGSVWLHLRICRSCGHVGCCEDSAHAHALAHFKSTGHPMIASLERDETWGWCYVDRRYFDPMPGPLPKRRSAFEIFLARFIKC